MGVCKWLRGYAPARWRRPQILDGVGDGAFVGFFDEVLPDRAPHGWDGWVFKTFLSLPVHDEISSHGRLVKSLSQLESIAPLKKRQDVFFDNWEVANGASLVVDDDARIRVEPVKAQRYVSGKVILSTSQVHRQCSGSLAPDENICS